jgi:hypothetical protein
MNTSIAQEKRIGARDPGPYAEVPQDVKLLWLRLYSSLSCRRSAGRGRRRAGCTKLCHHESGAYTGEVSAAMIESSPVSTSFSPLGKAGILWRNRRNAPEQNKTGPVPSPDPHFLYWRGTEERERNAFSGGIIAIT